MKVASPRVFSTYFISDPLFTRGIISEHFSEVTPLTSVAVDLSTPCSSSSLKPSKSTPGSLSSGGSDDNSLTKHLVIPSAATPSAPTKVQPRARLLTSAVALEMLEEKEQKKKKELELKEQKKRGREENKRKREEDQKRKQEERDKKAKEKARQKEQKAAGKCPKAKQKTQETSFAKAVSDAPTCSTRSSAQPPLKKARIQDETIDENKCCVCFTSYDEDVQNKSGKEWVMCALQSMVARRVCRGLHTRQHWERKTLSALFSCFCLIIIEFFSRNIISALSSIASYTLRYSI